MKMELEHLKSLETQRQDTQRLLENQRHSFQAQMELLGQDISIERGRANSWIHGLTEWSNIEKQMYEQRIELLEGELKSMRQELDLRKVVINL